MSDLSEGLIEHLVSLLADAGTRGLSIYDIASAANAFSAEDHGVAGTGFLSGTPVKVQKFNVDQELLSKIWARLGRHPDVALGVDADYNDVPLSEVQREFPGYLKPNVPTEAPTGEDEEEEGEASRTESPMKTRNKSTKKSRTPSRHSPEEPRLFFRLVRLYELLCGHSLDWRVVARLEFELMTHIAATKSDGLLQGELVQLSGQHKHSVPRRTDKLHEKGYIIKEKIFHRGHQTSRLKLKRFAQDNGDTNDSCITNSATAELAASCENLPPGIQDATQNQEDQATKSYDEATLETTGVNQVEMQPSGLSASQVSADGVTYPKSNEEALPIDFSMQDDEHPTIAKEPDEVLDMPDDEGPLLIAENSVPASSPPPTSTPRTQQKAPKRKRQTDDDGEVIRGRPRKYIRGTEKYWRMQLKQAKLQAGADEDEDDLTKPILKDRLTKAIYGARPKSFDQTLLDAMGANLPVPISTDDIDDDWVEATKKILHRKSDGLYLTPEGLRWDSFTKLSRVLIVKTPRLATLDLSDRSEVHPFRFIVSSASHSFAYRKYYPSMPHKARSIRRKPKQVTNVVAEETNDRPKTGPRMGIFYEDSKAVVNQEIKVPATYNHNSPGSLVHDTTDDDAVFSSQQSRVVETIKPSTIQTVPKASLQSIGKPKQKRKRRETIDAVEKPLAVEAPTIPSSAGRPTRKRKLTEKAAQALRTDYSRIDRLSSKSRSITPVNSNVEVPTSASPVVNIDQTLLKGIEEVAQSIEAPTQQTTEEASPLPKDKNPTPLKDATPDANGVAERKATLEMKVTPQRNATPVSNYSASPTPERLNQAANEQVENLGTGAKSTPAKARRSKNAHAICRLIVLELVKMTSGVVPNDYITLRRVSANMWREAGEERDRPLPKTVKAAVKSLCEIGKLKQVTFTFRGKSGLMATRSVIFLPTISPTSELVENTKQTIIAIDPADYIPSEWDVEAARVPVIDGSVPRFVLETQQQSAISRPASPTPVQRSNKKRRASSIASQRTARSSVGRAARSRSNEPDEVLFETATTGFLTLKIASLASLPVVQLHNWKSTCPVVSLYSDTSPQNPYRLSGVKPKRRRRLRKPGEGSLAEHTTIWHNFPSSIEDILQVPSLQLVFAEFLSDDKEWQRFACEVEGARAWEETQAEAALSKRSHYAFINLTVPQTLYAQADVPTTVEFVGLVHFDRNGKEFESSYPPIESWPIFEAALKLSPNVASEIVGAADKLARASPLPLPADATPVSSLRRADRPRKRKVMEDNVFYDPEMDEAMEFRPQKQRKRTKAVGDAKPKKQSNKAKADTNFEAPTRPYVRRWSQKQLEYLAVSVIVSSIFAGGADGNIDWSIVKTLVGNKRSLISLKSTWEAIIGDYGLDVEPVTGDLQRRYIAALEIGEAPSVDVEHAEATDWKTLADWALKQLDYIGTRFSGADMSILLPEDRQELLGTYDMSLDAPKRLRNVSQHPVLSVREDIVKSSVFGTKYVHDLREVEPDHENSKADEDFRLAKSWALASILTDPSNMQASQAQAKLVTLASTSKESELLLHRALKSLEESKLIHRKSSAKGAFAQGDTRTWEIHSTFLSRFESISLVSVAMLRSAFKHKMDVLDPAFQSGELVLFNKDAAVSDGDMLAVMNLMSLGQVRVRPGADVPKSRYGIDHEKVGYQTRHMDKSLLGFGVEIAATKEFTFGDPMTRSRSIPIPRGEADQIRGLIPPWIDINGNLNQGLWETFLVGVMGLIAQMPGISARDISHVFGGAIEENGVKVMLQWATEGGFAISDEKTGGYCTGKWWWMCITSSA